MAPKAALPRLLLIIGQLIAGSSGATTSYANTTGVGDYIAQGLGIAASSATSSALNGSVTSNVASTTTTVQSSGISSLSNGNDSYAAAQSCNSALMAYSAITLGFMSSPDDAFSTYTESVTHWTVHTTILCDGRPRALDNISLATVSPKTGSLFTGLLTPLAKPTCTINQANCASLFAAWSTSLTSVQSVEIDGNSVTDTAANAFTYLQSPRCELTSSTVSPISTTTTSTTSITTPSITAVTSSGCGRCTLDIGIIQLLYFPPTANISRDMCAKTPAVSVTCPNGRLVPTSTVAGFFNTSESFTEGSCSYPPPSSTANSGPFVVSAGTTFYENRAYILYSSAQAYDSCGAVGGSYTSGLLTFASSQVYSIGQNPNFGASELGVGYPVNFADFSAPIPGSAYLMQPSCFHPVYPDDMTIAGGGLLNGKPFSNQMYFCGIIMDWARIYLPNSFAPWLAVAPEFREVDPKWIDCDLGMNGLWDPPRALSYATTEAGISTPTFGSTAAPSPTSTFPPRTSASSTAASTPNASSTSQRNTGGTPSTPVVESDTSPPTSTPDLPGVSSPAAVPTTDSPVSGAGTSPLGQSGSSTDVLDPGSSEGDPGNSPSSAGVDPKSSTERSAGSAGGSAIASATGTSGGLLLDDNTASQGETISSDGTFISVGSSAVVFSDASGTAVRTIPIAPAPTPTAQAQSTVAFQFAGVTHTAIASSGLLIVDGTTVKTESVLAQGTGPSGDAGVADPVTVVVSGKTVTVVQDANDPRVMNVDGTPVTMGGGGVSVDGISFTLASSGLFGDGSVLNVDPPAATIVAVVDGQTLTFQQATGSDPALVIADGSTISLTAGVAATVNGVTLTQGSGGQLIADGTSTIVLQGTQPSVTVAAPETVITLNGEQYTASGTSDASGDGVVLAGSTLSQGGPAATINGVLVSVATGGGLVIGGTTTIPLAIETSSSQLPQTTGAIGSASGSAASATPNSSSASRRWSGRGAISFYVTLCYATSWWLLFN